MTTRSSARRPRRVPIWVRLLAALVAALGTFSLTYHLVFWFLWRFLFGEEVWPWPQWSLWCLVMVPTVAALSSAIFLVLAKVERRPLWVAAGIVALSIFGLVRYASEVWKVMFQLGFKP